MTENDLRKLTDVDRVIHEPARTLIAAVLYAAEKVDFLFLLNQTGLTKGNLSAHLARLESAGYVSIEKTYRGKVPLTLISLTGPGRGAFETYRKQMKNLIDHMAE